MSEPSNVPGFYDQHMFHPLLVFNGVTGHPIAAVPRAGNTDASKGAVGILERILLRLWRAYPDAMILVRADAGFDVPPSPVFWRSTASATSSASSPPTTAYAAK